MKKVFCLLALFQLFIAPNGSAQPKTKASKNGSKVITFFVKGIEYDNPAFEDLRKLIKGNIRVKQSTPGFSGDVAKITVEYTGTASELWDELPQSCKQNFKVTTIDNVHIDLQLKTNITNNTPTTSSTVKTTETKKEDCIDCYYYKNCYFDTSVVINGNTYRGNKNKTSYYFCKNGILYNKVFSGGNTFSQIIFKANEPAGTNWIDTFGTAIVKKTIISKGIGIVYNKTYYDDALIVYYADNAFFALYYYVKNTGFIKRDTVGKDFSPSIAASIKGIVDTSLTGLWKNYNDINKTSYYYKFNGDGTFTYYHGSVSKDTQMPPGISIWRVYNNYIEVYNGAWSDVSRIAYKKKNDPLTGKPAIVFGSENNLVYYISEDGRPAWK